MHLEYLRGDSPKLEALRELLRKLKAARTKLKAAQAQDGEAHPDLIGEVLMLQAQCRKALGSLEAEYATGKRAEK